MSIEPDRFETGRPMLLAGLRRWHGYADSVAGIPAQWAEFTRLRPLPGEVAPVTYGVMCAHDPVALRFEYMCAVEVEQFENLPEISGRMRVPEARYAVFVHPGDVTTIRDTFRAVHEKWTPRSGYRNAGTPDFERYGPGFDPDAGVGDIEIWQAVVPAA
jgi:AraC family transcriptional regulator